MRRRTVTGTVFDSLNTLLMLLIFVIMVYPFYYILSYSLSTPSQIRDGFMLFPAGFTLHSYRACLANPDIGLSLLVSIARTVLGPALMVLVTSMAAFALARDEVVGRKFFNKYFIFTMYFSGGLIPVYMVIKFLHLTNSFWVYILPLLSNAFYFVLVRTYIESIPKSLEEAALIDGANYITTFFRVIFPVCAPVIAAIVLFSCVFHWNSFIDNQLYNSMNRKLFTMQYVLYNFLAASQVSSAEVAQMMGPTSDTNPETLKMAITMITVVPILCVYPVLQKYFTSGLMIGSVKG